MQPVFPALAAACSFPPRFDELDEQSFTSAYKGVEGGLAGNSYTSKCRGTMIKVNSDTRLQGFAGFLVVNVQQNQYAQRHLAYSATAEMY